MNLFGTAVRWAMVCASVGICFYPEAGFAAGKYVEGRVIVKLKAGISLAEAKNQLDKRLYSVERVLVPDLGIFLVSLNGNLSVKDALKQLRATNHVRYAQADHHLKLREVIPNDELFHKQWNLHNTKTQADVRGPLAWDFGIGGKNKNGDELVIAIVDGGVDTGHSDLSENIWVNPGEIAGNKLDDDGNGYIDDIHGWNAFTNTAAIPANDHGTHVAGIAAAKGNNKTGIAGVNWEGKIMSVAAASATTSIVAIGYNYILTQKKLWLQSRGKKGANIVVTNSSFGVDEADCSSEDYPVWNDLYNAMGEVGILSVAATANFDVDVDTKGDVPTGCSSPYLINVTNTDNTDSRNPDSGWGKLQIHLGAPGTSILSSTPGNKTGLKTGCSMSAPHVAGAVAFLHSVGSREYQDLYDRDPASGAVALKKVILENTDALQSLKDKTVSGGRLNLVKSAKAIGIWRR